jgi:hypothetical protein
MKSVATARDDVNAQPSLPMGGRGILVTQATQQWSQHLPDPISQETLHVTQPTNDLAKNSFATQHTLAVHAQAGKTGQARDFLLKAMDTMQLAEPNSEVWFGFGLVAEQDGDVAAAENIYQRVEKPGFDYPGASYAVAQRRLATMPDESKSPKSSAGAR